MPPAPDPLVAQVGDQQIYMSDLADEIRELPGGGSPGAFAGLYNIALRRLIDRKAVVAQAVRIGLAIDPTVVRHIGEASDTVLEEAYLQKATTDRVTELMLLARVPGGDRWEARTASGAWLGDPRADRGASY